ncbi:putative phosphatidyl synthase [Phaeomoniella chlamydospora]|uniref:Putative phosphatidyl synthase n=1 Tax=Phaeomoniella chlamydospora TaxID=158046 RepID=A0A0G2HA88_PHACM|nr:putative phosphatidyl synthase [Phaeomoniella chlamydospora]
MFESAVTPSGLTLQRIKTRETHYHTPGKVPLTKKLLTRLTPHENIYTLPNILTFSRLIAAPLVGYFIATSQHTLALSLFFYAGVTDLVDGYIARRYNMQTVVGSVIDPMADKALMTISVIALAMRNAIPWWLASIILLRDVGLGIAAVYYRWISLPPPKTMARYWDFSLPSAEVKPTQISKYNTFLQLLLVGAGVALPVLPTGIVHEWNMDLAFQGFQYLVALTTVWSGASYAYSKDAVKILTQDEVEERLANKKKREQP